MTLPLRLAAVVLLLATNPLGAEAQLRYSAFGAIGGALVRSEGFHDVTLAVARGGVAARLAGSAVFGELELHANEDTEYPRVFFGQPANVPTILGAALNLRADRAVADRMSVGVRAGAGVYRWNHTEVGRGVRHGWRAGVVLAAGGADHVRLMLGIDLLRINRLHLGPINIVPVTIGLTF